MRVVRDDRINWRTHVLSQSWADLPLDMVSRTIARDWWSKLHTKGSSNSTHSERTRAKPLAASTLRNIRQCVRKAFADAELEGLIEFNPFQSLPVGKGKRVRREVEPFPVLYPDEQRPALELFGRTWKRWLLQFALGSALRKGEQWALRLKDVHLDASPPWIDVLFGHPPDEPTKNGLPRRIYLFGLALEAMIEWLKILPTYAPKNPHGLVFPREDGTWRHRWRVFRDFSKIAKMTGRRFTWHGLRHSALSALAGGWWGEEPWIVQTIAQFAGHSSVEVTEKYIHFVDETLRRASARMRAPQVRSSGVTMSERNGQVVAPPAEIESATFGLGNRRSEGRFGPGGGVEFVDAVKDDGDDVLGLFTPQEIATAAAERLTEVERERDSLQARFDVEREISRRYQKSFEDASREAREEIALRDAEIRASKQLYEAEKNRAANASEDAHAIRRVVGRLDQEARLLRRVAMSAEKIFFYDAIEKVRAGAAGFVSELRVTLTAWRDAELAEGRPPMPPEQRAPSTEATPARCGADSPLGNSDFCIRRLGHDGDHADGAGAGWAQRPASVPDAPLARDWPSTEAVVAAASMRHPVQPATRFAVGDMVDVHRRAGPDGPVDFVGRIKSIDNRGVIVVDERGDGCRTIVSCLRLREASMPSGRAITDRILSLEKRLRTAVGLLTELANVSPRIAEFLDAEVQR